MDSKPIYTSQEEHINKLHGRHLAKLLDRLRQINTAEIIIEAIKQHLSRYTNDIKYQVLAINPDKNDHTNKR